MGRYAVIDANGHELASLAEVVEATRLSRKLDGAVAVLGQDGTVLARVVSGTGGAGDRGTRAALKWQERQKRRRRKVA